MFLFEVLSFGVVCYVALDTYNIIYTTGLKDIYISIHTYTNIEDSEVVCNIVLDN